jgi:ABC-type multidrug transport system fused ATPase/permease subunit
MDSFLRALKFAWPFRWRLAGSLACGVVVAVFWGANISAIYPLLTVLLENKTLVEWTDGKIAAIEREMEEFEREVEQQQERLAAEPDADAKAAVAGLLCRRQDQLADREAERAFYKRIRPYVAWGAPATPFRTLCLLLGAVMLGMVVKTVFDFLQEYLSSQVVNQTVFSLRREFFRRTIHLDLEDFSETQTHELTARFTSDMESLSSGLRALLGKVLLEPMKSISCLAFACFFNWRLTLATLLLVPAGAVLMGTIGRYLKRVSRRHLESHSRIYKILQETFLGIFVVKAFSAETRERMRFYREAKRNYLQSDRLARTEALAGPLLELLTVAGICAALLAGSYLVLTQTRHIFGIRLTHDPMTPGLLMTFYALLAGMSDPIRKTFSVYGRVQRGVAASERIFASMDRRPRIHAPRFAPKLERHRHSVEFSGVEFGYHRSQPVLKDVDLRIEFGETLAVVGPTGCGKTTLVHLLPRFYDPARGSVSIDGQDVRDVNVVSLRRQIGLVTQHTVLFDDTVYNNIAYGCEGASRERVEAAARAAYAHRFIEALPHGYETTIGEMGASLSGGQRQRIALARALLRDPAILILDEATSSLDVESESLIHRMLREFKGERTVLMVTHRMSALDVADRIAVVSAGRLEAVGTLDEILKSSPTFRRMHDVHARSA